MNVLFDIANAVGCSIAMNVDELHVEYAEVYQVLV